MFTTPLRIVLTAVLIVEAIGDGDEHNVEKRHVSILARLGQLPSQYQGKRVEKSSLDELAERLEEEQFAKRYLGALARTGDLRIARDQEEKRDELDGLVHDLEARRTRLDALRDDLFHDEEELPVPEEKRSMAALARAGALPKRVLDEEEDYSDDMSDDKRGISSIARNGYYQKRMDDDLEQLMSEVYGIGEKRTVASLARGFSLPQGKRNIASIVRGKKDSFEETNEEKRNLPSIVRDRTEPLGDKRHIGSFVANHGIPFVNEKRNVGALAKNRDYPYALKFGKRSADEEVSKRQHVATLLRQGRLPSDHASEADEMAIKDNQEDFKDDVSQIAKEDAEHSRTKREAAEDMDKRYFGVRGGGKMPGGRLPKVGSRSRNRHENSGRRRH